MDSKKPYEAPALRSWGTVTDLTQTGLTRPGNDLKQGSVMSQGG
ncbi:MAG: lasso RiPP family leader peptide-containing protein [Egibacteraceae bacterium]